MATEAFVNNKVTELETSSTPANITYLSPTSANAVYSYTTPGTYSLSFPSSVRKIKVTTVGGGGASASGGCGRYWCYWGGGGGAVTENITVNIDPGTTITIVVGSAGEYTSNRNGGDSYISYKGKQYAYSKGGGSGGKYPAISYGYVYNGYAGGSGGGNGGKCEPYTAPGRGRYGTVYTGECGGGGASWGNGAGYSGRTTIKAGIGGGASWGWGEAYAGDGAVFINY